MITEEKYKNYFGVETTPNNFKRLEYLSLMSFKSIMVMDIPDSSSIIYEDFEKALMEQMNYLDINADLTDNAGTGGYSLGSYSESSSDNKTNNSKSITRISPVAYDILMAHGLLYCGLRRCNCG